MRLGSIFRYAQLLVVTLLVAANPFGMHEGQIAGILEEDEISQESVLLLAVGKRVK